MSDLTEIEHELRKLRPAQPSPILFERVAEAMDCRASVSDAGSMAKWRRRFAEWTRGDASDIDAQLVRASEQERSSQTPYSFGLGLAAAAVLLVIAAISMQRPREREEIARTSTASQTQSSESRVEAPAPSNQFIPAGATRLVYNERNEGVHFANGSAQPLRRVRYQTHETWQWRNPTTGASLRVSYPSEEVVLIPVSGQ